MVTLHSRQTESITEQQYKGDINSKVTELSNVTPRRSFQGTLGVIEYL